MFELINKDQRQVLRSFHNKGHVMNDEQYLRALRRVGVDETIKDIRKLEKGMRETLKTDTKIPVVDRVYDAVGSVEAYVRRNRLSGVVRPGGSWGLSIGRTIAAFMLQGIFPYSFRE